MSAILVGNETPSCHISLGPFGIHAALDSSNMLGRDVNPEWGFTCFPHTASLHGAGKPKWPTEERSPATASGHP